MARCQFVPLLLIFSIAAFSEFQDCDATLTDSGDLVLKPTLGFKRKIILVPWRKYDCNDTLTTNYVGDVTEGDMAEGGQVGVHERLLVNNENQLFDVISMTVDGVEYVLLRLHNSTLCVLGKESSPTTLDDCSRPEWKDMLFELVLGKVEEGCQDAYNYEMFFFVSFTRRDCLTVDEEKDGIPSITSMETCLSLPNQRWFLAQGN